MNAMSSNGPMISRPFSVDNPWISTMETHHTVVLSKSFISSCSKNLTNYHDFLRIYIELVQSDQQDRGFRQLLSHRQGTELKSAKTSSKACCAAFNEAFRRSCCPWEDFYIYLYEIPTKIKHENVGRYTNRPMDGMGGCNFQKGECRSL